MSPRNIRLSMVFPLSILGLCIVFLLYFSESLFVVYISLVALFVVGIVPIVIELLIGKFDFLNPKNLFVLYFLFQMVVPLFYSLSTGKTAIPWLKPDGINNQFFYSEAMVFSIIGLSFFYIGYFLKIGAKIGESVISFPKWRPNRVGPLVVIMMTLSLIAAFILFNSQGGIQAFLINLAGWRSVGLIGQGYLIFPVVGVSTTAALIYFLDAVDRKLTRNRILGASFLFALSLIPAFFLGFRGSLVTSIIQFCAIWHYAYKPFSIRKIIFYSIIALVLFTLFGLVRENLSKWKEGFDFLSFESIEIDSLLEPVVLRSRGAETTVAVIQSLAETHDYQYWWRSIIEATTIMIPHKIWPDKPTPLMIDFGFEFMGNYLYWRDGAITDATGGVSPTAVGFFIWQMGLPGVMIGMFVLGIFAKISYRYFNKNPKDPSRILIYVIFLSSFLWFAESPQDALNGIFIRTVFAILVLFLLTARTGSSQKMVGSSVSCRNLS